MTRTRSRGLALLLSLAATAACGDERTRPAPVLEPEDGTPAVQLEALVSGGSTTAATLEGSGLVVRVTGRDLPVPSELVLTATADAAAGAFFTDLLPVASSDLVADFTVRAGSGALVGASEIALRARVLPGGGGEPAAADSARVPLR